jgi:hypothetical protein
MRTRLAPILVLAMPPTMIHVIGAEVLEDEITFILY